MVAAHLRKIGFCWHVSILSHCRAQGFAYLSQCIHRLRKHALRGLFSDGVFWEFHWKILGEGVFEHGLLVPRVMVGGSGVSGTDDGALRLG